ncbi:MAG TPA: PTS sugar transporter subunit IIA [Chthoniobacterales bacterium]|nr:PTS sugar transporter subunit IIA [Chthoniobacterales bacterium]
MAVVLADLLDERSVTLELQAHTCEEALREIIATMRCDGRMEEPDKLFGAVLARERVHSTFVGRAVAFPHARTNLVDQICLGIGRSREGVSFGPEGELAHLIFVIAVPQRMATDYLTCVGTLARLSSDEKTRAALDDAKTPAEFVEVLRAGSLLLL